MTLTATVLTLTAWLLGLTVPAVAVGLLVGGMLVAMRPTGAGGEKDGTE